MKKNDEKKQRNRFNLAFFRILLVFFAAIILLLCLTAILLCVFNQKTVEVQYKTSPEMSVVPGEQVSRANFEFDVRLPKITNQLYNLVIYDVAFSGGKTDLVFADMNRGEWEYSLDGDPWRPLILTGGERILQANATEGERMLSIRATDALDLDAEGGKLHFKIKLESNGQAEAYFTVLNILWLLIGFATGCMTVLLIFTLVFSAKKEELEC